MPIRKTLKSIEGRTGALFLTAGVLFVVFAALHGVEAFLNRTAPKDVFGPAGFAFAFVGMLGLYPSLVEEHPRLVRFGATFAGLGMVASMVTSGLHVGLWVFDAVIPADASVFALGMVLGQFLGYVPFGVATLRADVHSRSIGLLLVAVPTVLAAMIVTVAIGFATSESAVVLGGTQAVIHLVIGGSLWTEGVSTEHATPSRGDAV